MNIPQPFVNSGIIHLIASCFLFCFLANFVTFYPMHVQLSMQQLTQGTPVQISLYNYLSDTLPYSY